VVRRDLPRPRLRSAGDVDASAGTALGSREDFLESAGTDARSSRHGSRDSTVARRHTARDDCADNRRNDSTTRDELADSAHSGSAGGSRPGREEVAPS